MFCCKPWSAKLEQVLRERQDLRISGRRRVCQGDRAVDGVRARVRLLVLPHPPDAINLSVVQVEPRVTVGCYEVAAWVAANGEVAGGVHAHEVVLESRNATLHVCPEAFDALAFEQVDDLLIVGPLAGSPGRDVTLEAARIVAETEERQLCGIREVAVGVGWCAGEAAEDWAHIHAEVLEWPVFKTATTLTMGNEYVRLIICGNSIALLFSATQLAVTAHAGVTTIKGRR